MDLPLDESMIEIPNAVDMFDRFIVRSKMLWPDWETPLDEPYDTIDDIDPSVTSPNPKILVDVEDIRYKSEVLFEKLQKVIVTPKNISESFISQRSQDPREEVKKYKDEFIDLIKTNHKLKKDICLVSHMLEKSLLEEKKLRQKLEDMEKQKNWILPKHSKKYKRDLRKKKKAERVIPEFT